jgi:arylsulfatase A
MPPVFANSVAGMQSLIANSRKTLEQTYRLASPLHHLDKQDPPCWFITGENDDLSTRANEFRKRMTDLGIQSDLTVIKGAPHPFTVRQVWFDKMIETAGAFLEER